MSLVEKMIMPSRRFVALLRNSIHRSKTTKALIILGVTSALFSILIPNSTFVAALIEFFDPESSQFILNGKKALLELVFGIISFASFSLLYLQSGAKSRNNQLDTDTTQHKAIDLVKKDLKNTQDQLSGLVGKFSLYESEKGFSNEARQQIIDNVGAQISEATIQEIFNKKVSEIKDTIKGDLNFEKFTSSSASIKFRLQREIVDLRLRSNINLLIGMMITAIGLYLLWTTVTTLDTSITLKELASKGSESDSKFYKNLILPLLPRVLLVIFVEIFAYFFLRLYKAGLSEIKYFQNELTNVESKLAAVEFAYITNNQQSLKTAIERLAQTERNFILEKGQTTVELEKAKSESDLTRNIIKTIPGIFKNANKRM